MTTPNLEAAPCGPVASNDVLGIPAGYRLQPFTEFDATQKILDENERLREFIQKWTHDGRLQTFQDRERFRKEAATI